MTTPSLNENVLTWTFENYATIASAFSGLITCALIIYIYQRSGSVFFLRDLIWKFFGGTTEFENKTYERNRKELREIEHYRFEFNIPAQSLQHTELVEAWISKNDYSHRDISKVKNYIDWKNFKTIRFKEKLFSKNAERLLIILLGLFMLIISIALPLTSIDYLMVSLKNAPNTPSFYLSQNNAKFKILSDTVLTISDCRSSDSLQKFILPNLSEKNLDSICSVFLDPKYNDYIERGLKAQRGFLFFITTLSIFIVIYALIRLHRLTLARSLHDRSKLENQLYFPF